MKGTASLSRLLNFLFFPQFIHQEDTNLRLANLSYQS